MFFLTSFLLTIFNVLLVCGYCFCDHICLLKCWLSNKSKYIVKYNNIKYILVSNLLVHYYDEITFLHVPIKINTKNLSHL